MVCIWVRLTLAYLVWTERIPADYARMGGLIGMYLNLMGLGEDVWWSRRFHLLTSTLLLIGNVNSGLILAIDVLGGLAHSLTGLNHM